MPEKGYHGMGSVGKHAFRRYAEYALPYKWRVVVVLAAGAAVFVLPMGSAWLAKILVDEAIIAGDHRLLWRIAAGFTVLEVLRAIALFIRGANRIELNNAMVFDLRQDLWKHLQRLSLGYHQSRPTGSIVSRLMGDVDAAQNMISSGMINVGIDTVCGLGTLAIMFTLNWQMTLVTAIILPVYGVLYRVVNPQLRVASHGVREQTAVLSGSAVERLGGIALVQSFAQEGAEAGNFAQQSEELRGLAVKRGRLNLTLKSISQFLVRMGGHSLWIVGGLMAMNTAAPAEQRLTLGGIVLFTGIANHLYGPVQRLSDINILYQNSMAAIERIFAVFDTTPAITDRRDARRRPPEKGDVEFRNAGFRYGDEHGDVLRDLSFHVEAGCRAAIVGESGAGKSTLVMLIPRLYDVTEGAILIDGVDVRDYSRRKFRRSIGIVLQDTILFSGTIRENLRYGNRKATQEQIEEAAGMANAYDFITSFPKGFETVIGERGLTLSGGQRQRISIARTILQDPRILILDEATSSLDSESENLIADALETVMQGRTSLIIAHRLSTVVNSDVTLVLHGGRLVEKGKHARLLERGGYYKHLFDEQFARVKKSRGE